MGQPFDASAPVPAEPVAVPTTTEQDLLAAALAALMPLGAGFLVLIAYLWMDVFGVILGLAGVAWWAYWWRKKRGAFFPKDLQGSSVTGMAVFVAVLGLIFALAL